MKKKLSVLLTVSMLCSCMLASACGNQAGEAEKQDVETVVTESEVAQGTDTSEATVAETSEATTEEAKEPAPYVDKLDRSDEGFVLVWNDEFDGDALDTTKWDYQYGNGAEYGNPGWGNSEWQYYLNREENVRVEDGKLIITALYDPDSAYRYTSARIRTITNTGDVLFATTYGRVEARIKLPASEGMWPAFWLLPADDSIYGGWAASGEIDVMEAKGRLPEQFSAAMHYGGVWPSNTYSSQEYVFEDGSDITDYHLYSVEWEPGEIRWYVDNECYYTVNNWSCKDKAGVDHEMPAPFDVPFYILLNMAIGGKFDPQADLENAEFPAEMEVDFVRVYQKEEGYGTEEEGFIIGELTQTEAETAVE